MQVQGFAGRRRCSMAAQCEAEQAERAVQAAQAAQAEWAGPGVRAERQAR